jgi:hypothetical protein
MMKEDRYHHWKDKAYAELLNIGLTKGYEPDFCGMLSAVLTIYRQLELTDLKYNE